MIVWKCVVGVVLYRRCRAEVESYAYGLVVRSEVRALRGMSIASSSPQVFVDKYVVDLSSLLGWTVVCGDLVLWFVIVRVRHYEVEFGCPRR